MASLAVDENRVASQAIMLLLLTGARRNEVTQARWDYIDFERRTLLVPRSKSGEPRLVSLNGAAIALLKSVPRSVGNPYIFPSPVNGRPMPHLFFPWARIRRRAGLEDVRVHDLRHSFASILVNNRVPLYTVQRLLGHANARSTQRYAHVAQQTLLDATEVVGSVVAPEPTATTLSEPDTGESSAAIESGALEITQPQLRPAVYLRSLWKCFPRIRGGSRRDVGSTGCRSSRQGQAGRVREGLLPVRRWVLLHPRHRHLHEGRRLHPLAGDLEPRFEHLRRPV